MNLSISSDKGNLNDSLGPHSQGFRPFTFLAPNKTFDRKLDIEVAGIKLELIRVPSETANEIAAGYPEERVMVLFEWQLNLHIYLYEIRNPARIG